MNNMNPFHFDIAFNREQLKLDISLEISPGITLLLGPNGAGKSSLLRLLAGLEQPDRGSISSGNRLLFDRESHINIPPSKRRVGMLFQNLALFPHLNVRDNIGFGLKAQRIGQNERDRTVADIIDRFELQQYADKKVTMLSGGERQKVALARTLAARPDVLLLDEPTSTLDQENRWRFRAWLAEILTEWQIPTLMVTHDPADAASFRKRIVVLENGRISQSGSFHQLLNAPATSFIADFAGVNFISGSIETDNDSTFFISQGGTRLLAPFERSHAGTAFLTVLPWEVSLYRELPKGSPRNIIKGTIQDAVILGDRVRITVLGQEKLVAEISLRGYQAMNEPGPGETVFATFKAREARVENC